MGMAVLWYAAATRSGYGYGYGYGTLQGSLVLSVAWYRPHTRHARPRFVTPLAGTQRSRGNHASEQTFRVNYGTLPN